jgi:hypothetical protein
MWPSLPVANHIADIANIFFIASLVVGVAATVVIVWMSGVKEAHWEKDRTEAAERIEGLQKDTAEANARALEAGQKAELERLERVKLEIKIAPRRLSGIERDAFIKSLVGVPKPATIAVVSRLLDSEGNDLADDLSVSLDAAGWHSERYRNWTMLLKGVFVAVFEGTTVEWNNPSISGLERALAVAGITHAQLTVEVDKSNTMNPQFQPNVLYLLIGSKP